MCAILCVQVAIFSTAVFGHNDTLFYVYIYIYVYILCCSDLFLIRCLGFGVDLEAWIAVGTLLTQFDCLVNRILQGCGQFLMLRNLVIFAKYGPNYHSALLLIETRFSLHLLLRSLIQII